MASEDDDMKNAQNDSIPRFICAPIAANSQEDRTRTYQFLSSRVELLRWLGMFVALVLGVDIRLALIGFLTMTHEYVAFLGVGLCVIGFVVMMCCSYRAARAFSLMVLLFYLARSALAVQFAIDGCETEAKRECEKLSQLGSSPVTDNATCVSTQLLFFRVWPIILCLYGCFAFAVTWSYASVLKAATLALEKLQSEVSV